MPGRVLRILITGVILWLLWGERVFWPARRQLPEGTVLVVAKDGLQSLASGQNLAIDGTVYPAGDGASEGLWKERFAYRHATWQKDEFGSTQEVVTQQVRPAIRFEWAGGTVTVPAESYKMESAPKAPGDSLLKTTEHNVGFRAGDAAVALGRKLTGSAVALDAFAEGPLDVYLQKLERGNAWRAWIGYGLRVVVTLLALSALVSALSRTRPVSETPA